MEKSSAVKDRKERAKSEDMDQQMERSPADRDRKERSRSEEVEQQADRVVAVSSRFSTSLQDLVHLSRLSRSTTSASVQDLRLTVKQQKIRRTNSIQEAIRRATSHTELNISSGPEWITTHRTGTGVSPGRTAGLQDLRVPVLVQETKDFTRTKAARKYVYMSWFLAYIAFRSGVGNLGQSSMVVSGR